MKKGNKYGTHRVISPKGVITNNQLTNWITIWTKSMITRF